jgi:thiol:disulfide interchange protein
VAVLSARILSEAPAEALFALEEAAKLAETVWDADEHKFNRVAPEVAKAKAELASKPKIYDESADGARQLAEALVRAKAQHKRVLLQFGANWCAACHELHEFFEKEQGVAEALKRDYVVVMIDVNNGHNHGIWVKYGQPHVLPTIVVVADDGKMLTASNPENWNEGRRYSAEKVLAFLNEWTPKK